MNYKLFMPHVQIIYIFRDIFLTKQLMESIKIIKWELHIDSLDADYNQVCGWC